MVNCRDVRHKIVLEYQMFNVLIAGKFVHIKTPLFIRCVVDRAS